jgi:hypothetical protein
LKASLKERYPDGNPAWKSMALFPTAESLGNFLTAALVFLGDHLWNIDAMLNFLDNAPKKSFVTDLKIQQLTNKVRI